MPSYYRLYNKGGVNKWENMKIKQIMNMGWLD